MTNLDSTAERILCHLEEKFGQRPALEDPLAFIGVDSIGMAELTVEMEREFNIRVDSDIVQVDTVGELIEYIKHRLKSQSAS